MQQNGVDWRVGKLNLRTSIWTELMYYIHACRPFLRDNLSGVFYAVTIVTKI